MVCKGICHKYKASWGTEHIRYSMGQKRCNVCEIFVHWDGRHCPCCGMMLRTRPKLSRYRQKCIIQRENLK